ncbi:MAG TPA: RHS repeat-associated core domain-containing protein [Verrucomicrobiae bacterium]
MRSVRSAKAEQARNCFVDSTLKGMHGMKLRFLPSPAKRVRVSNCSLAASSGRSGSSRRPSDGHFRKVCRCRSRSYLSEVPSLPKNRRTCFEGPFGEVIRATGPMAKANPFRFSTKLQDDETDLLYYGYRYCSAGMGRWISTDPIGERGGLNLYGFVGNAPTEKCDYFGLVDRPGGFAGKVYNGSRSASVTVTGDVGENPAQIPYVLAPSHNSVDDYAKGLTRIADVDFITGATKKVYKSFLCCAEMKLPLKVGAHTVYVIDCNWKDGVYLSGYADVFSK